MMIHAGFSIPATKHRRVVKHVTQKMFVSKDLPVNASAGNVPQQQPAGIFFRASYVLRDGNLFVTREELFFSPEGSASAVQQQSNWKIRVLELKFTVPEDQSRQETIVLII